MTDDERRHYNNLILLCDECHTVIDNPSNEDLYPVSILKEWKQIHEIKAKSKVLKQPRILNQAINSIADLSFGEYYSDNSSFDSLDFQIDDKIEYNFLHRNREVIKDHAVYYPRINRLYEELEFQGSFKKQKLLMIIYQIYLKIKGRYPENGRREKGDDIFEAIENEIITKIEESESHPDDVDLAIPIILVDAFMRCKILEKPQYDLK